MVGCDPEHDGPESRKTNPTSARRSRKRDERTQHLKSDDREKRFDERTQARALYHRESRRTNPVAGSRAIANARRTNPASESSDRETHRTNPAGRPSKHETRRTNPGSESGERETQRTKPARQTNPIKPGDPQNRLMSSVLTQGNKTARMVHDAIQRGPTCKPLRPRAGCSALCPDGCSRPLIRCPGRLRHPSGDLICRSPYFGKGSWNDGPAPSCRRRVRRGLHEVSGEQVQREHRPDGLPQMPGLAVEGPMQARQQGLVALRELDREHVGPRIGGRIARCRDRPSWIRRHPDQREWLRHRM